MDGLSRNLKERAFFHSSLSFLYRRREFLANRFLQRLTLDVEEGAVTRIGDQAFLFVRTLEWDTNYFRCPTYRIEFADWTSHCDAPGNALAHTLTSFLSELKERHRRYYVFAEVPSEDLAMIQGLGAAGFRLIETRLGYFRDDLQDFTWPQRFAVREATEADISNLREVASNARNRYDRFHADGFFSVQIADEFLAVFAENSVKGFADVVLVPNDGETKPDAFFTGRFIPWEAGHDSGAVGQIVLVAVGETRRGWHLKLMSEMALWFKGRGVRVLYMVTQATNRPVIRNCEKLSFRLGRVTHILASSRSDCAN
jgi:dTDP-4-amino-4,6-dideoxy-D-galactose acyltransferase